MPSCRPKIDLTLLLRSVSRDCAMLVLLYSCMPFRLLRRCPVTAGAPASSLLNCSHALAQLVLDAVLLFRVGDAHEHHVVGSICAAGAQRVDVVDHVAWAAALDLPGGRAGDLLAKCRGLCGIAKR